MSILKSRKITEVHKRGIMISWCRKIIIGLSGIYIVVIFLCVGYVISNGVQISNKVTFWFRVIYCLFVGAYILITSFADQQRYSDKGLNYQKNHLLILASAFIIMIFIAAIWMFINETCSFNKGAVGSVQTILITMLINSEFQKRVKKNINSNICNKEE